MSLVIVPGKRQRSEVEFFGKHPDVLATCIAAGLVEGLAEEADKVGTLSDFRADLNVQAVATRYSPHEPTPLEFRIGGQVNWRGSPEKTVAELAEGTVEYLLHQAQYFVSGHFQRAHVRIDTTGIAAQSRHLNGTSRENKFADTCSVVGHYIAPPWGIQGTFPGLMIGKEIDTALDDALRAGRIPEQLPDGKVHVTICYTERGFSVEQVTVAVAHEVDAHSRFLEDIKPRFLDDIKKTVQSSLEEHILPGDISVNRGGDFSVYFLQADAGVSKVKDSVLITGGNYTIGTDAVWGKCLFKASSVALPYAFALSRVVADSVGARYASVSVHPLYGSPRAEFIQLEDIDLRCEEKRARVNAAFQQLPHDPQGIRDILGMPVAVETYDLFNDVAGFHLPHRPWKTVPPALYTAFENAYNAHK